MGGKGCSRPAALTGRAVVATTREPAGPLGVLFPSWLSGGAACPTRERLRSVRREPPPNRAGPARTAAACRLGGGTLRIAGCVRGVVRIARREHASLARRGVALGGVAASTNR